MGVPIAGTAFVKVDGRQLPLKGSFIVSPSPVVRSGIAGQDGVHGYQEMPRVPFIEGDISTLQEVSIEDLEGITDATVQADLINGNSYVLREAWTTAAYDIDTAEGSFKIRFEGVSCDEIGA